MAQTPLAYEQGLTLARAGRFQEAEQILSAGPTASRSATHHYVLASCYARLLQSDLALSSATLALQTIPALPPALQTDAVALLRWAAFSEGTKQVKVVSVAERFKLSSPETIREVDMLELGGNKTRQAELLAVRTKLGQIPDVAAVFQDIDRARSCRSWQEEKIPDPSGGPAVAAVECDAGGEVNVVYGGALLALINRYTAKLNAITLP